MDWVRNDWREAADLALLDGVGQFATLMVATLLKPEPETLAPQCGLANWGFGLGSSPGVSSACSFVPVAQELLRRRLPGGKTNLTHGEEGSGSGGPRRAAGWWAAAAAAADGGGSLCGLPSVAVKAPTSGGSERTSRAFGL